MTSPKYDAEFRITERDWLRVQLDLYSLKHRGTEFATSFEVKSAEVICNIHTTSIENMRRVKKSKEEHERFYLGWAKSQRSAFADIICQFPTLSKVFDPDRNLTININDDSGKGAVTVCTIRGGEIQSHFYAGDLI